MFGLFGGSRKNRRSNKRSNRRRNNTRKNKRGGMKNPLRVLANKLSKTTKQGYSHLDDGIKGTVQPVAKKLTSHFKGGKRKSLKGGDCGCNNQNGGKRRSNRRSNRRH